MRNMALQIIIGVIVAILIGLYYWNLVTIRWRAVTVAPKPTAAPIAETKNVKKPLEYPVQHLLPFKT